MNLRLSIQLLKSASFLRLWNSLLLFTSFYISRITKKAIYWGSPMSISIEPTTSCNLQCPQCPSGLRQFTRPTGVLNQNTLQRVLDQFGKKLWYVTFYFQGEPYLVKDFSEMVRNIKSKRIFVSTSTNANWPKSFNPKEIIDSKLDRLLISLDGIDAETYTKYRKGGDFNLAVENIKKLVHEKKINDSKHPFIELQFIVFKHNEHQISDIKLFGKELNVDKVVIKTAQIYDYQNGLDFIPSTEKFRRYKPIANEIKIKSDLPNHCRRMWFSSVITWDGEVVPCCFDKDASYKFGNINSFSLKQITNNTKYQNFRLQLLTDRKKIDICRNCSEGIKKK